MPEGAKRFSEPRHGQRVISTGISITDWFAMTGDGERVAAATLSVMMRMCAAVW